MFKRILTFVAAAAAAVTISSCQKDDKPTVEFEKSLYTVFAKRSVDVNIILSEPATENVTVNVTAAGAVQGTDYEITGNPVTIKAGETVGTFTVNNLALTASNPLNLGIECPAGYSLGTKFVTIVTPDPEETLVYSFQTTTADVLGSYVATINVTGVTSGDKLSLSNDVLIPLKLTGDAAQYVVCDTYHTKNYSSDGKVIGKNTVSECTMFMASDGYDTHTNAYYLLSAANRAFSKDKETIGEAVVVFTIIDGDLAVELRDYDTPPFGKNWWDEGDFDADMFSFASLFVRK